MLPIIFGYKKRYSLLWLYAITGFIFDIFISFVFYKDPSVKHPLANVFIWVEFCFIYSYYYAKLKEEYSISRYVVLFAAILIVSYSIIFFRVNFLIFNSPGAAFFCILYILFSIAGFLEILKQQEIVFLNKSEFFWVNVAFIINSSGVFLLLLTAMYFNTHAQKTISKLWPLVGVLNTMKYTFITFGLKAKEK